MYRFATRIRRNADGGDVGGNANNPTDTTQNDGSGDDLQTQLDKVNAKNKELLGEIRSIKDDRNSQRELNQAILAHLGIEGDNPLEQLKAKQQEAEDKANANLSDNDRLRIDLQKTQNQVDELLKLNKAAEEKAAKAELDNEITSALTDAGFNDKGRNLLDTVIRTKVDQKGRVLVAGESKSVAEYALSLVNDYPEFVNAGGHGGGGSAPSRVSNSDAIKQKMNDGNVTDGLRDAIRNSMAK